MFHPDSYGFFSPKPIWLHKKYGVCVFNRIKSKFHQILKEFKVKLGVDIFALEKCVNLDHVENMFLRALVARLECILTESLEMI